MSVRDQIRSDLKTADAIVRACWDNFVATEPTYVLRDLIVIEIEKAREAEREACAKIAEKDDMLDGTGLEIAAAIRARSK